jgi:glycerol-3-phosphate dehydrogenase
MMYDIAVIGAGVVGAMIARTLSAYDLKICILEKGHDVAVGASSANSAIVHAGFDAKEGSLKARLNVRGSEMMPKVCRELGVKYKNNGSLVIGFDEDDRKTVEALCERGKQNGVRGVRVIDQSELRAMEQRMEVALLLDEGLIYNDILDRTGASSATISRVNRALMYGADGYQTVIPRLREQEE